MASELDIEWLKDKADNKKTLCQLEEIVKWRIDALESNSLRNDSRTLILHLDGYAFECEAESSFSFLEVYQEIFRDNNHFLEPGFSAQDAGTVLDIGANYGVYALSVKKRQPDCKIICAEPNPYVFPYLRKNIELNCIEDISLINKAVSSAPGKMHFDLIRQIPSISGIGLRTISREWMEQDFIQSIEVETTDLPTIMKIQHIEEIDILKIDVEGMEMDVLKSSTSVLASVKKIVVERHSRALRNEVASLLEDCNFELVFEEDCEFKHYYGDLYFTNRISG